MIYYITGGERSGKSTYAQNLALSLSDNPVYLATAKPWDGDFQKRIRRHQEERDHRWTNIEEQKKISEVLPKKRIVVIDCVTLWLTNYFNSSEGDVSISMREAKNEFDKIKDYQGTLIIVSNEIGMGVHANSKTGRDFVSLQGWMNQYIAAAANEAILMVSGIPVKLKSTT